MDQKERRKERMDIIAQAQKGFSEAVNRLIDESVKLSLEKGQVVIAPLSEGWTFEENNTHLDYHHRYYTYFHSGLGMDDFQIEAMIKARTGL